MLDVQMPACCTAGVGMWGDGAEADACGRVEGVYAVAEPGSIRSMGHVAAAALGGEEAGEGGVEGDSSMAVLASCRCIWCMASEDFDASSSQQKRLLGICT